jgi:hypothetical protein
MTKVGKRNYGWLRAFKAASYLLLKKDADINDFDAARIIHDKLREFTD